MYKLLSFLLLLSSCAFHQGTIQSNLSVSPNEFTVKQVVQTSVSVNYFLGLGGNKRYAMMMDAKRQLYRENLLHKGEYFINYVTDYKKGFYLIFNKVTLTLSAEIIELKNAPAIDTVYDNTNKILIGFVKPKPSEPGKPEPDTYSEVFDTIDIDSVAIDIGRYIHYGTRLIVSSSKTKVSYHDKNFSEAILQWVESEKVFRLKANSSDQNLLEPQIGDTVNLKKANKEGSYLEKKIVFGVNETHLLLGDLSSKKNKLKAVLRSKVAMVDKP